MEHFWLAVAIASLIWALFELNRTGWELGKTWLLVPLIAVAMFVFRRFTRKKMEAYNERERQRQNEQNKD